MLMCVCLASRREDLVNLRLHLAFRKVIKETIIRTQLSEHGGAIVAPLFARDNLMVTFSLKFDCNLFE